MEKYIVICFVSLLICLVECKTYTGTIYAQHWFKLWVNGKVVAIDPVVFTPNNAVKFQFEDNHPCRTYAILASDGGDDETGLYLGDTCQANGGIRVVINDGTVSSKDWKFKRILYGPTNLDKCFGAEKTKTCRKTKTEECRSQIYDYEDDWCTPELDVSVWDSVTEYPDAAVGYGQAPGASSKNSCLNPRDVTWGTSKFIWGNELLHDNQILLRYTKCDGDATNNVKSGVTSCNMSKPSSSQQMTCSDSIRLHSHMIAFVAVLVGLFKNLN